MKEDRVRCIDGLKGMCAIVIAFCVHYQVICKGHFPLGKVLPYLSYRGHFFVELFFMMSGFGIYYTYADRIIRHEISFKRYIARRLSKFYVLHVVSTLFCAIFQFGHILKTGESIFYQNEDIGNLILNLLLLQSGLVGHVETFNAAAWFLSVVILCHIAFYWLHYIVKNKTKVLYIWGMFATISIIVLYNLWAVPVFNRFTARGFLSFFIGILICRLYFEATDRIKKICGITSTLVIVVSYIVFKVSSRWTDHVGNYQLVYSLLIMPAFFMSVLFVKPINILFSSKPLYLAGKIATEVFLLHYPVMYGIKTIDAVFGFNLDFYSYLTYSIYVVLCVGVSVAAMFIGKTVRKNKNKIKAILGMYE